MVLVSVEIGTSNDVAVIFNSSNYSPKPNVNETDEINVSDPVDYDHVDSIQRLCRCSASTNALPEEMAKMQTDQMKTACSLTADQVTKVQAINVKFSKKMGEMFSQGPGGDFAEIQKKMTEMESQKRAEFVKILSADQLIKYDNMVAEQRKNMQGPPM